jgi:hypothetical protein
MALLTKFNKFINDKLGHDKENADSIEIITSLFKEFALANNLESTGDKIKINLKTSKSSDKVKKVSNRKPKDPENLSPFDCFKKIIGENWKKLSEDEKKEYLDEDKLTKTGKPCNPYFNYQLKFNWKEMSKEEQEEYKTTYYQSKEDEEE